MEVTLWTWIVAVTGLLIISLLATLQLAAVIRPRGPWIIKNVYGGHPDATDPTAYFAFNGGFAYADLFLWAPLHIAGNIGMLLGARWGFLLALMASVPYWYTAIQFFIWDRDLRFRQPTLYYWIIVWGMFPVYGVLAGLYCFVRLL